MFSVLLAMNKQVLFVTSRMFDQIIDLNLQNYFCVLSAWCYLSVRPHIWFSGVVLNVIPNYCHIKNVMHF